MRVSRPGIRRGSAVHLTFDGEPLAAHAGETVAAALMAAGIRTLRTTDRTGEGRGVFCGMGTCYDCLAIIDGEPSQRTCMIEVSDGMQVARQVGSGEA